MSKFIPGYHKNNEYYYHKLSVNVQWKLMKKNIINFKKNCVFL